MLFVYFLCISLRSQPLIYRIMIKNNEIFMNPYTDFGFKKLFGTEPNKDILISFLNSVFQGRRSPIVNLQYLNTEVSYAEIS